MRNYFKRKYFDYVWLCEKLSIVLVKYLTILYKLLFFLLQTISKGFSKLWYYSYGVYVRTRIFACEFSKRFQMVFARYTLVDLECYFLTRVSYPFLFCCFFFTYFSGNFVWRQLIDIRFWWGTREIWSVPFCSGLLVYFVSCSAPIYLWFCVSVLYSAFKYNLLFVIVLFYEIIVLMKMIFYLCIFIKWFGVNLN